jgi:hypothetical protein
VNLDFTTAMDRVYRDAFARHIAEWAADFGYDVPTMAFLLLAGAAPGLWSLSLNIALDLPAELDEFTDEEFIGWLTEEAATRPCVRAVRGDVRLPDRSLIVRFTLPRLAGCRSRRGCSGHRAGC